MKQFFFLLGILLGTGLFAQRTERTEQFTADLDRMGLAVIEPLDENFRARGNFDNPTQNFHYRVQSKYDDVEYRFYLIPYDDHRPQTQMPHVETGRIMMNVATNEGDEEEMIVQRNLDADELQATGAEWGAEFYLRPKRTFTERYEFCRLVSLYREGRGTVLMFVLFNDPGNRELDRSYDWLRFHDNPN